MHLLCWNRVEDFTRWLAVFASHEAAHVEAGLILVDLWREKGDPSLVHYLFEVRDNEKAMAFINAPDASEAASQAGVVGGEFHFVESHGRYG